MQIHDETIQRLVDGELSVTEYQDALQMLEADPSTSESNAWRRCALAFLEAQAFELGAKSWLESRKRIDEHAENSGGTPAIQLVEPLQSNRFSSWRMLFTVAGSLVLAFWIGSLMGDLSRPATPPIRGNSVVSTPGPRIEPFSADGLTYVSVPVVDENAFDRDAWLAGTPTPLPLETRQKWERAGFAVRASRRLIPKTVEDGRTILVPIEQYEMVPSDNTPQ